MVLIRRAEPSEFTEIGELCAATYAAAGIAGIDSTYARFLADPQGRANAGGDIWAAIIDDEVVGSVTMCPFGSSLTVVCRDGEMEPRAIAVNDAHQRQSVGSDLVAASVKWAQERQFKAIVVCVTESNTPAHRLYARLGFTREPDRDWIAPDGTPLQTYSLSTEQPYCGRCGEAADKASHVACAAALELEPPRYCCVCKRRMVVQIMPTGWTATCSRHGSIGGKI